MTIGYFITAMLGAFVGAIYADVNTTLIGYLIGGLAIVGAMLLGAFIDGGAHG